MHTLESILPKVRRMIGSYYPADVDELTNVAVVHFLKQPPEFWQQKEAYIIQAARNNAVRRHMAGLQQAGRHILEGQDERDTDEVLDSLVGEGSPEARMIEREELLAIAQELRRLKGFQKELVILLIRGYTVTEIAKAKGVAPAYVSNTKAKIASRMRGILARM